ncbi:mediator of RNA polymerase II transcription subunit 31-like isoform X7 [Malus sylvestris]|uniref:mediator of RNA polymerase II transcription subunit 31-like isoform X7 n=1 Tax=Malus sylvestris TaxID=3752 RepID=UPI0021AC8643|nr:mediator of RNA polymerase II transcription subunit 31-like isoform X7 [Malus sylvestris]
MASGTESDDTADTPPPTNSIYKDPDDGRQRFLLELEFVQCLANPTYIHYLAQNRYFEDEAFIGYPHCLFFLEQLQNANFRAAMAHPGNKELAHRQQFYFWKNYRNNRLKHILPRPLPEPVPALPPPAPPQQSVPPVPPVPSTTVSVTATPPAPSPMQYAMPPGSAPKVEPRNSGVDRRKRKRMVKN